MIALEKNGTWVLVDLTRNKVPTGYKWVYTVKLKPDGSVDLCKAHLIAKGYTRTYRIDYQEFIPKKRITKRLLYLWLN